MPFITVKMLEGRTQDQKRALVKEITEAIERTCNATPENTLVLIEDVSPDQWAKGGVMISERP
ncbi:4-oxalocrotonate tautomerase family protein [Candidatus Poribacteria bacterium]|jgi:4-oxalocrotonate tautomerase|nr:4-oxalocrotonate tautomerase [Candidatus Poribacteria bacterium]MBT3270998.1 4-oxalocrotonate tautomerase family protein [Candidatus Poribacteria bacterium]MBT5537254.1 4-oxalocrotonate tautomerase family protein [Candidatus Poribacteria bacterium]MBT5714952.1 4-oxalocrotonate tautomerase family protein [Candidatus Poribacteria bacterium]MBT7101738.1 4-oxalocrotonate tautomerase family protein [Candidatus Poribacteria bacterium]